MDLILPLSSYISNGDGDLAGNFSPFGDGDGGETSPDDINGDGDGGISAPRGRGWGAAPGNSPLPSLTAHQQLQREAAAGGSYSNVHLHNNTQSTFKTSK